MTTINKSLSLLLVSAFTLSAFALDVPKVAPKQTKDILLLDGLVHIGDGSAPAVRDILLSNGVIVAVGPNLAVSTGDEDSIEVIDLTGQHVYPGIIALDTQIGLSEIDAVRASVDHSEVGTFNSNVKGITAYDSGSVMIPTLRSNGILLAQVAPIGGQITGLSSIVQLDAWNPRDARYSPVESLMIQWSSDKKAQKALQERFDEGAAYSRMIKSSQGVSAAQRDLRLEVIAAAVDGKHSVFVRAQSRRELLESIEFLKLNKLKGVLVGAGDADQVLKEVKESGFPIVLDNPMRLPNSEDAALDQPYLLTKILEESGILFTLRANHFNGQYRNLPLMAGMAAAYGLDSEAAIRSITLNAAKILGIAAQTGSLEAGKDANLFVSRGDILETRSFDVSLALIQGRKIDLNNHQKELFERYRSRIQGR